MQTTSLVRSSGLAAVAAVMVAGCGVGGQLRAGPSLAGGHPGGTVAVEGAVYLGDERRAAAIRFRVGVGYHAGLGPTLVLGVATGPAWGRWAAGLGANAYVAPGGVGGVTAAVEVDRALASRRVADVTRCPTFSPRPVAGATVDVREVRVGLIAGGLPGASLVWAPISLGVLSWIGTCPPTPPPAAPLQASSHAQPSTAAAPPLRLVSWRS